MRHIYQSQIIIGLIAICVITLLIYWPGLYGTYLLDDFPNLEPLGHWSEQDTKLRVIHFLTSGAAGPTGRPVMLASVLLHDTTWPIEPFIFKYTNLLIHLLNGILVFWFTSLLLKRAGESQNKSYLTAIFISLLWLLHPIQASTVLYAIQRATELSTLFTLAALISWLYGRRYVIQGDVTRTLITTLSVVMFGLLSVFSKENGALLPLYILCIEILLWGKNNSNVLKLWLACCSIAPTVLLAIALAHSTLSSDAWQWRPFTMGERLLSEANVLTTYLGQIFIPRMSGIGIFHDDFPIAAGIIDPPVTLLSLALIAVLIYSAWATRARCPILSFAITWYFACHLMESTILPLELYFEHRNYLAILGPLLALTYGLNKLFVFSKPATAIMGGGYLLLLISVTSQTASLWGKPLQAPLTWANENPASIRAQLTAHSSIKTYANINKTEGERHYLQQLLTHNPDNATALLTWINFQCANERVDTGVIHSAERVLMSGRLHPADITPIQDLLTDVTEGKCGDNLSLDQIMRLANAALHNPHTQLPVFQHSIHYILGQIYTIKRDLDKTMYHFDKSYHYKKNIDIRLQQAFYLYSAGLYTDADSLLEQMESDASTALLELRRSEIEELKRALGVRLREG